MNLTILLAGLVAGFITLGHFTVGRKRYLRPMLQAEFDAVARKVIHCVFHYISAFLVLSAIFLLFIGAGYHFQADTSLLVKFISINFGVFTVVQIVTAATSSIRNAIIRMFQWTLFAFVAVFAWVGVAYPG
ncbi:MAG: hypothetical protein JSW26_04530 [Desulfobacterales bacterium]|nr:MAG: hypothetical protein JSW26_04530 [Desulfobacterales bacterium]